MWKNQIEYFDELVEKQVEVKINFLHTNKVYIGYIRAICSDGVFVTRQTGFRYSVDIREVVYIPYKAISCVERGL